MMDDHEKLLRALLSEQNRASPLAGQGHGFDENDLAAHAVSGALPHGRKDLFHAALAAHPTLREGVAFERELQRDRRARFQRFVAAACVILSLGIGAFAIWRSTPTSPYLLMGMGRYEEALAVLEEAPEGKYRPTMLVAAQYAIKWPNDHEALSSYSRSDYPFLPPEESLLRSEAVPTPASEAPTRPRILFLGGYVRGDQAMWSILPDRERSCRVLLYKSGRSIPLYTEEIAPEEAPRIVSLPKGRILAPLERFGLELWSSDGERIDHREFQVASDKMLEATHNHLASVAAWLSSSESLRLASCGNIYFHAGFYEAAVEQYSKIPAKDRTATITRILERFGR